MATTRIKDISSTVTSLASDDYIAVDGATNGTRKMVRSSIYTDVAAAFTGAPTTYDICPLNSGTNKIDATYLPTSGDTPKGEWNANTNSPSLADGSGAAGDYYDVTTAGTQNLGSGNITFTVGDVVKYNGSTWYKIDSVANFLDGYSTAATSRTALVVNSIDEDAEATALKLVGPALYFDGSNDVVTVADNNKLTFSSSAEFGTNSSGTWSPDDNTPALTDGTGTLNQHYRVDSGAGTVTQGGSTLSIINGTATSAGQAVYYDGSVWRLKDVDDSPLSISFWLNMDSYSQNGGIVSKFSSAGEWLIWNIGNTLRFVTRDGSVQPYLPTTDLSSYLGKWTHFCVTYAGAGPNSAANFPSSMDAAAWYVNGVAASGTGVNDGAYAGMPNTSNSVSFMSYGGGNYSKGHIRNVQIFNRELAASEVAQLAKGNDLGFADEWAGALGGVGTIDETVGISSWTGTGSLTLDNITETANTTVGGRANVLKLEATATTTADTRMYGTGVAAGKRERLSFDYYIPSSNTTIDVIRFRHSNGTQYAVGVTKDAWTRVDFEYENDGSATFQLQLYDATIYNATAGDYVGIDNFSITQIGTLADFRSERFDSSTNKWYDLSANGFVGTNSGATLVGREVPVYATDVWTPAVEFGGASSGTYSIASGFYTRVGNVVHVSCQVNFATKSAATGSATIIGLPFSSMAGSLYPFVGNVTLFNAANLTSAATALVVPNSTTVNLYDWGAGGTTDLDDTNFAANTIVRFSATYQIA